MLDDDYVKAGVVGVIGLMFVMIRNLMARFKRIEERADKVDPNHQSLQQQILALQLSQQQMQKTLDSILEIILRRNVRARDIDD